jgi:hypothetical protein
MYREVRSGSKGEGLKLEWESALRCLGLIHVQNSLGLPNRASDAMTIVHLISVSNGFPSSMVV